MRERLLVFCGTAIAKQESVPTKKKMRKGETMNKGVVLGD